MFNLSVRQLGSWLVLIGNVINIIMTLGIMRLQKLFSEGWNKSPFHVSHTILNVLIIFAALLQSAKSTSTRQAWV